MSRGHGAAQLQGAPFRDCFTPGLAQCTGAQLYTVPWGRDPGVGGGRRQVRKRPSWNCREVIEISGEAGHGIRQDRGQTPFSQKALYWACHGERFGLQDGTNSPCGFWPQFSHL